MSSCAHFLEEDGILALLSAREEILPWFTLFLLLPFLICILDAE